MSAWASEARVKKGMFMDRQVENVVRGAAN
jgi:hypothetical protein